MGFILRVKGPWLQKVFVLPQKKKKNISTPKLWTMKPLGTRSWRIYRDVSVEGDGVKSYRLLGPDQTGSSWRSHKARKQSQMNYYQSTKPNNIQTVFIEQLCPLLTWLQVCLWTKINLITTKKIYITCLIALKKPLYIVQPLVSLYFSLVS